MTDIDTVRTGARPSAAGEMLFIVAGVVFAFSAVMLLAELVIWRFLSAIVLVASLVAGAVALAFWWLSRRSPQIRVSSLFCVLAALGSLFFLVVDSAEFPWFGIAGWVAIVIVALVTSSANFARQRTPQFLVELVLEVLAVLPWASTIATLLHHR